MPYLNRRQKGQLANSGPRPRTAGELTYKIQQDIQDFLNERGNAQGGLSYTDLALALGAIEGARFDFEDRVLRPYELAKRQENGDVWNEGLLRECGV